jgi:hypothetical protein
VPVSRMTHIEHVTHVWSSLQQQRDHMSLNWPGRRPNVLTKHETTE